MLPSLERLIAYLQAHNPASLPEEILAADEEKEKVLSLLDQMEPREAEVLRLHYGLEGRQAMSLKEIGEKFGLTRERIRQIRRDALVKLYEQMSAE